MRSILALALLLALIPPLAQAATVMAYLEEAGASLSAGHPHPVRDGLLAELFDLGHIVFDLGETSVRDVDWKTGASTALLTLATEGGAELIVVARSETRVTPRGAGRPLVEITLSYNVVDAAGMRVRTIASGILSASNRGKEDTADAIAMARGLGAEAATAVNAAWSGGAKGSRAP